MHLFAKTLFAITCTFAKFYLFRLKQVCTQDKQFWKIPVKTFLSDLKVNLGNAVSMKVSEGN